MSIVGALKITCHFFAYFSLFGAKSTHIDIGTCRGEVHITSVLVFWGIKKQKEMLQKRVLQHLSF